MIESPQVTNEFRSTFADSAPRLPAIALALLALAALTAGVYRNAVDGAFVYDDLEGIAANGSIRSLTDLGALLRYNPTRPLVNVSYAVDYARTGLDPAAYHVTNIVLHVLNVWLLYFVVLAATRDWGRSGGVSEPHVAAISAAALFAVHPMMTEAVAYASGRSELLCGAFFLAGLIAGRRALFALTPIRIALAWLFLVLALASKEVAIMLPVLLLLYDKWLLAGTPDERRARWRRLHAPALAVLALLFALRIWLLMTVEYAASGQLSWRNAVLELEMFARYTRLFVWPAGLSIVHAVHPLSSLASARAVLAVASIGATIMLTRLLRKSDPLTGFGIAWFGLLLVPSAGLVILVKQSEYFAEHRAYIAGCGLFLCAGVVVEALWRNYSRRRTWIVAIGVALVVLLAALTIQRNRVWQHPVLVWRNAVEAAPDTWAAQYGYARALHDDGAFESAVEHYRRAISLRPDDEGAYQNLALTLIALGHPAEARTALDRAIRLAPETVPTRRAAVSYAQSFGDVYGVRAACADLRRVSPAAAAAEPACAQ